MATSSVRILMISLILFPLAFHFVAADRDEEGPIQPMHKTNVVVEGMIYCQNSKTLGTSSLWEAKAIPKAKVSVTCTNYKNYVFYYNTFTADEHGYFYAKLEGFKMEHQLLDHPLTSCKVSLLSSPQESCNVPTKINNGIRGASLCYEHKRLGRKDFDIVIYAAGPLAFQPAPSTSDENHY